MRRSVRRNHVGVALFPFLAVLICTMGALIVLLVLLVQQAQLDAKTIAHAPSPAPPGGEALRQRVEDAQWRREMLEQSRAEKSAEMAAARAKLAHLEEHIQRLKQQAEELVARAKQIDQGKQLRTSELASAKAELASLNEEIARKQRELEQNRARLQEQERWYALIPYDGPNGTRRRPIYIECTAQGIVIQPEGIVLSADDFNGPLGPGNPLDAALRTIREHLLKVNDGQTVQPYPLLVVRPGGIIAYQAARAALKSWDDEFGYELVSDDKKLAFGEPDPALASQLQQSVAVARQRQEAMVAMMPRRYQNDEPLKSFSADALPSASRDTEASRPTGFGIGPGGGASGIGGAAGYPTTSPSAQTNPLAAQSDESNSTSGTSGARDPSQGDPSGPAANGAAGKFGGPTQTGRGTPIAAPSLGSPNGPASSGQAGTTQGSPNQSGAMGGGRGSNWGLQGANGRSTAVTRPIHVAVLADRVILVPEKGVDRLPQHLMVSPQMTSDEADRFVAAVQREMKSWGLAVANGYWKPILQIEVARDAEHQFQTLVQALDGSGFEIERKQP